MITKFMAALFTPKYPKGYTGRHRAQLAYAKAVSPTQADDGATGEREATAEAAVAAGDLIATISTPS